MPKANHGGATFYGYEGVVLDSHDRPSELDPSRNVDGSVVEGFESDERDLTDRKDGEAPEDALASGPVPVTEQDEKKTEEVPSSDGDSSKPSPLNSVPSKPQSNKARR